ncbi:MAG: hypothetical protein Q9P44_21710, partial [Anaerolineae bacterium]|nr:hypothetical protein [Anaerolineae bacterium]
LETVMMRRIFKGSLYTMLGFFGIFFFAMILGAGFPNGSTAYSLGIGLAAAVVCSSPIVMLTALITGIGTLVERNSGSSTKYKNKRKNDFLADFDQNPRRLQHIMSQLSPDDRAYLQEELANRRLGVSNDGELISLDDLLDDDSDNDYNSLFTG